jgi:hypothetical protein
LDDAGGNGHGASGASGALVEELQKAAPVPQRPVTVIALAAWAVRRMPA